MTVVNAPFASIARSELYTRGGVMLVPGWFGADIIRELLSEARERRGHGTRGTVAVSDGTEQRGGSPARDFVSAPAGASHWNLHGSGALTGALARVCSADVVPIGSGTYSYYEPGDFLAVHRDVETCDLAVITCLAEAGAAGAVGGLVAYPDLTEEPLSTVRAAGRSAGARVPLAPGDTAALLGGLVPHEVLPVARERIVAIMCYRLKPDGARAGTPAH